MFLPLDCFQFETIINLPDIGTHLIHMLGAIISGSQVYHFVRIVFNVFVCCVVRVTKFIASICTQSFVPCLLFCVFFFPFFIQFYYIFQIYIIQSSMCNMYPSIYRYIDRCSIFHGEFHCSFCVFH